MQNITLNALVVTIIVSSVLPILVGMVTKVELHPGLKAVILLFLAAVQGLIVTATTMDGTAVISKEALIMAAVGWVTAVATHFGFWKPSEVTEKVAIKTRNFGLGRR